MISIIVNSYNFSAYIIDAINSLLAQDYEGDYEVIVVDDASTDNTKEILSSLKHPKLHCVFLETNGGGRKATELAFAQCKGKYICRFDGDDKWPPFFLTKAATILDTHHEIDMVYGDCSFINSDGQLISFNNNINRRDKHNPVLENEFIDILKHYYINAPTIMFRRTAFEKAVPMPVQLSNFADWFISLKVLQFGKAWYIHEPIAFYRIHTTNMHRQMVANKMGESVTRFIMQEFVCNNKNISTAIQKEIIALNYFTLGEKYFGLAMWQDAARLYQQTMQTNFKFLVKKNVLKHYVGALFPKLYHALKA